MSITVRDLFLYNPNFASKDIEYLTGKPNFTETNTINLSRVEGLNDKDFSIFVGKLEGTSFVNSLRDNNMRTQVADATGIKNVKGGKETPMPKNIPMERSVFDINKRGAHFG